MKEYTFEVIVKYLEYLLRLKEEGQIQDVLGFKWTAGEGSPTVTLSLNKPVDHIELDISVGEAKEFYEHKPICSKGIGPVADCHICSPHYKLMGMCKNCKEEVECPKDSIGLYINMLGIDSSQSPWKTYFICPGCKGKAYLCG